VDAPNAALTVSDQGVFATGGAGSACPPVPIRSSASLAVLELLVHATDVQAALREFARTATAPVAAGPRHPVGPTAHAAGLEIWLGPRRFFIRNRVSGSLIDATRLSLRMGTSLLRSIARGYGLVETESFEPTAEVFHATVASLRRLGLLAPAPAVVDWGDLRRLHPMCHRFGFLRGTPIDRYYTNRFLSAVQDRISGVTVELGGARDNPRTYGWTNLSAYQSLDLAPAPHVDLVGDAHDPHVLPPGSVDCVVALNVLEHCAQPWRVVANMHGWLRDGGRVVCMVPNAQRVHRMPRDYWRPLPDGVEALFADFPARELFQYGNPTSLVASFLGLAAEELTPEELDTTHPDYPVATCIVATK
jgi:hypothetical protein